MDAKQFDAALNVVDLFRPESLTADLHTMLYPHVTSWPRATWQESLYYWQRLLNPPEYVPSYGQPDWQPSAPHLRELLANSSQKERFAQHSTKCVSTILRTRTARVKVRDNGDSTLWMTPDARPPGARSVPVVSTVPAAKFLATLVENFAYPGSAAWSCAPKGHLPWFQLRDDRRKARNLAYSKSDGSEETEFGDEPGSDNTPPEFASGAIVDPKHPYVAMSPTRRTTQGGGFTKEQVTRELAKMRVSDEYKAALFEVVYQRQLPKAVVARRPGLKLATIYVYSTRLRERLEQVLCFQLEC